MREKTMECFSYMSLRITFKEAPNAPTPCVLRLKLEGGYNYLILWLQPEGGSNMKEAPTPQFFGSNWKVDPTTYPCPVLLI
jgi:hypothetical protein